MIVNMLFDKNISQKWLCIYFTVGLPHLLQNFAPGFSLFPHAVQNANG